MTPESAWLASHLRDVPDFPEAGIVFKDVTPLLADAEAFRALVDAVATGQPYPSRTAASSSASVTGRRQAKFSHT